MFPKMVSRLIARWAVNLLLASVFTTLLLMMFLGRAQNEEDTKALIKKHKHNIKERLRLDKLRDLQKDLFKNPIRPKGYTYNINVSLSELTPLEREIPDSRPAECAKHVYDYNALPTVTVIIPFYNEALSMLLRTVHSLLKRTPDKLLKQIILVNDNSPNADLGVPLEKYIKLLPENVILVKTKKREGLIRARMIGAQMATGDTIMFQVINGTFTYTKYLGSQWR